MKAKRLLAAAIAFAVVFGAFGAVSEKTVQKLGAVSASADDGVDGDFEYSYEYSTLYITGYKGTAEDVVIPGSLNVDGEKVSVHGIKEEAFFGNINIKTLKISTTIRSIGSKAFGDCTSLKSVEFVNTDDDLSTCVNELAFAGCSSLESVVFPENTSNNMSNIYLYGLAFLDCTELKSVTIPDYIYLESRSPAFGYERTNRLDEPYFTYSDEDNKIDTNLKKTSGFVMKCYSHTSAAVNAYICELETQFINAPASVSALTEAVNKSSKDNPNYDVKMTDQSISASRVNNLGGYIDVIDEYYYNEENKVGGFPVAAVHSISDIKTGKSVLEHVTAFPYTLYDPTYSDGVFSVSCFGVGRSVQEAADLTKMLDKSTHLIKDIPEEGVTLNLSKPLYYGTDGKLLFEHEYITGDAMVNGYVNVASNYSDGSAAILDKTGKAVLELPTSFGRTGRGGHGGDMLSSSSSYSYYSTIEGPLAQGLIPFSSIYKHEGKTIFDAPCEQDDFDWALDEQSQRINGSNTCGYIDLEGNIVIPQSFMQAGEFTEDGLAWVCMDLNPEGEFSVDNHLYGYIDTKGKTVIPTEYEDAFSFDSGYAVVKKDGKFGMIDTKNNNAVSFKYDDSKGTKDGFMVAKLNGSWGMVDKYDNVVIPFMFEDVSLCIDGTAFAVSDGKVYRFDISEAEKGMLGDVNDDKKIDIQDAVMIINHINGVAPLTEEQSKRANVDLNSKIDISDAATIINHVNGVSAIVQPE